MNPKHRSYRIYLEDIESSMLKIFEYIGEKSFIQFKQNSMLVDAVVRNFEVIGDSLPQNLKDIQRILKDERKKGVL